jgi:hypothetical protein
MRDLAAEQRMMELIPELIEQDREKDAQRELEWNMKVIAKYSE